MMKRLTSLLYIMLSILALNFLIIIGFIGINSYTGRIEVAQLGNIARVLTGTAHFAAMDSAGYNEYQRFLVDKDALIKDMREKYGSIETQDAQRIAAQTELAVLRDKLGIATDQLASSRRETENVRRDVQALQRRLERQQMAFREEVARQAAVEIDRITKNFRKMVPQIDAGATARILNQMIPDEAARHIRDNFTSDYAAEVMNEIDEAFPDKAALLWPKLENKYAGSPADAIARLWTAGNFSAAEMAMYMHNMNSSQALATYLALPPSLRETLTPLLME